MKSGDIVVRKGIPEDVEHFIKLFSLSSPLHEVLWGDKLEPLLASLYPLPDNLYSYTHSYFVEVDGDVAGMLLGYDCSAQDQDQGNTRKLILNFSKWEYYARFFDLLKVHRILGGAKPGEYLVSNTAVYEKYRRRGLYGLLMYNVAPNDAISLGCHRIIAHILNDNFTVISRLTSFGWKITKDFKPITIGKKQFKYHLMELTLNE